jgi:hypothetical protein
MMSAKVRFSPASQLLAAWASILAQHTADRPKHDTLCDVTGVAHGTEQWDGGTAEGVGGPGGGGGDE